jgi:glycosyltransferase involved in cell wall biosynthesis
MPPSVICVNTQTPLVQFLGTEASPRNGSARSPADLAQLREGVDYRLSPGGVTRMVYPMLRRLLEANVLDEAHWVALNPQAPPEVRAGRITLHNIALGADRMAGYGETKEAIWGRLHDTDGPGPKDDLFWTEAFAEYAYYNRRTAERIRELDAVHDFDVFYVHDFQQMPVGRMLGTLKPKLFRWHIPFEASSIPEPWRATLTDYLESYDAIIVSSARYAASLGELAPRRKILRLYPYIDPAEYSRPGPAEISRVAGSFGLAPEDDVALLVGRMDPIKGQDVAIAALAEIADRYPHLRLVLVGNGSFSGSKAGLGLSKSARWRTRLEELVVASGLEGRVVFTGHVDQAQLDCLYERSRFTLLPSVREGFGLVAVESWLHGKPAIITRDAGVAELVRDGENALLFDPRRRGALARAMRRLLDDRTGALASRLARRGRTTSRRCSLDAAVRAERAVLAGLMGA